MFKCYGAKFLIRKFISLILHATEQILSVISDWCSSCLSAALLYLRARL